MPEQSQHHAGDVLPLVSVCVPTRNRRRFIPRMVASFLAQDYPSLELIVVDSGEEPIADLLPESARYMHSDVPLSCGSAVNRAVREAHGEFIVRFDDDDWQFPGRVSRQIDMLRLIGKSVLGMCSLAFYSEGRDYFWDYVGDGWYSPGATLAFRREWALEHPFPSVDPEDVPFTREAYEHNEFACVAGMRLLVACTHDSNCTSRPPESHWEFSMNFTKRTIGSDPAVQSLLRTPPVAMTVGQQPVATMA